MLTGFSINIPRRNESVSTVVHFAGLSWSHTASSGCICNDVEAKLKGTTYAYKGSRLSSMLKKKEEDMEDGSKYSCYHISACTC